MKYFISASIFILISLVFIPNLIGQSPKDSLLAVFNNDNLSVGQRRSAVEAINSMHIEISIGELYQINKKIDELIGGKITTDTTFFLQLDRALLYAKANEIKTAEQYYDEAYEYYKRNKHLEKNGFFFSNYANIKNQLGKNTEAIALILLQINICEKYERWQILSKSHYNLGNFYAKINQNEEAKKSYSKALEIAEKHNLVNIRIKYLESLGLDALDLGNLSDAEAKFLEAIKLSDVNKNMDAIINLKNNLGIVYEEMGKFDDATQLYNEVEMMAEKMECTLCLANVNLDKGHLEIKRKNFAKAIQFCTYSKENYLTLGDIYGAKDAYYCMYEAAKTSNDYKGALLFYENYKKMSDSLTTLSNVQQITELRKDFEFQKEKEKTETEHLIEISRQKSFQQFLWLGLMLLGGMLFFAYRAYRIKTKINAVISQQNSQLEKFNTMNENLIYSLSHDIKEPMLGLQFLLSKLKSDDPILQNAALNISSQVGSVNSIVNNLLQLKKSTLSDKALNISGSEINLVVEDVLKSLNYKIQSKNLNFENLLETDKNIKLPISRQKLYLVLLNLLSNAIKFSSDGQRIQIYTRKGGIFVRDFGKGIDEGMLAKIGKEYLGTSSSKIDSGLGLILVNNVLEGTGIALVCTNMPDGGAEVGLDLS
ncbi:MAG TPA: tetratricopeptide repeat-containing sensor histidine kinase [Saprospiraceae bacterium]|nr:tetratricopeptide repeat-containing sensor histidine kinase [Saprospiraceae bacterium]